MSARHVGAAALLGAGLLLGTTARAASASEVFAQVSPSIWRVQTYDKEGLRLAIGSAVVIGPERLVTNCHVLARAGRFVVRREQQSLPGRLEFWDTARDLCQLQVAGLAAPAVSLGNSAALQVGQTVYTIGNPKGLDLTLSDGLLSSLRRNARGDLVLIQTSAPISHGSSGGGMFDEQGRLIGITTQGVENGQNLNFAVPVEWVRELPQRHARLHGSRTGRTQPSDPASAPAMPAIPGPAPARVPGTDPPPPAATRP